MPIDRGFLDKMKGQKTKTPSQRFYQVGEFKIVLSRSFFGLLYRQQNVFATHWNYEKFYEAKKKASDSTEALLKAYILEWKEKIHDAEEALKIIEEIKRSEKQPKDQFSDDLEEEFL